MNRKWIALGVTMAVSIMMAAGLTRGADKEETPTGKLMEKVNKRHSAINKTVRTPVAWTKGASNAANNADEMVKLFKEAREIKDSSVKQKKPFDLWTKEMDDMIKETEAFAEVARKPAKQPDAKTSFERVKAACAACHKDFRPDEDEKF